MFLDFGVTLERGVKVSYKAFLEGRCFENSIVIFSVFLALDKKWYLYHMVPIFANILDEKQMISDFFAYPRNDLYF